MRAPFGPGGAPPAEGLVDREPGVPEGVELVPRDPVVPDVPGHAPRHATLMVTVSVMNGVTVSTTVIFWMYCALSTTPANVWTPASGPVKV